MKAGEWEGRILRGEKRRRAAAVQDLADEVASLNVGAMDLSLICCVEFYSVAKAGYVWQRGRTHVETWREY